MTAGVSLKYPEDYNGPDYRYWIPRQPTKLGTRERGWVAKMVTVRSWQILFEKTSEKDKYGEPVWAMRSFGYVQELNKYVPEEELKG